MKKWCMYLRFIFLLAVTALYSTNACLCMTLKTAYTVILFATYLTENGLWYLWGHVCHYDSQSCDLSKIFHSWATQMASCHSIKMCEKMQNWRTGDYGFACCSRRAGYSTHWILGLSFHLPRCGCLEMFAHSTPPGRSWGEVAEWCWPCYLALGLPARCHYSSPGNRLEDGTSHGAGSGKHQTSGKCSVRTLLDM